MRIYLIGMPGSGKSYWAQQIAEEFLIPAFDLDDIIAQMSGMSIADIFQKEGEKGFRRIERELLLKTKTGDNFVMATGGGTPCYFENINDMLKMGLVVHLSSPVDVLADRIIKEGLEKRPLFKTCHTREQLMEQLIAMQKERAPFYKKAPVQIDFTNDRTQLSKVISKYFRNSNRG